MARPPMSYLKDSHPDIASEYSHNNEIPVDEISSSSHQKVLWICPLGHEYSAVVYGRTGYQKAGCSICNGKSVLTGFNDFASHFPHLTRLWDYEKNSVSPQEVSKSSGKPFWWKCSKNHSWKSSPHALARTTGCPRCQRVKFVSVEETELFTFIQEILPGIEVIPSVREIPEVTEVDVFIPSLHIAIEYNGAFWHSERYRTKYHHRDKVRACREAGIQLIQVWDDDWRDRRSVVEKMLRHKLGVSVQKKVFARTLSIETIPAAQAKEFLDSEHIQGFPGSGASIHIGMFSDEELVAVASFKRSGREARLERYATSCIVVGGFSRVLKYFVRESPWCTSIVTFADLEISDGSLYRNTGWSLEKEIPPDYKYLYKGKRRHKFGFRLKRFRDDPELSYDKDMSESQLAELNGIPRVWDSGKLRFRFQLPEN